MGALDGLMVGGWYNLGYALQQLAQDTDNEELRTRAREAYDHAVTVDPAHKLLITQIAPTHGEQQTPFATPGRTVVQLPFLSGGTPYATQLIGSALSLLDNTALRRSILGMAARRPSASVSNQGGWHSG